MCMMYVVILMPPRFVGQTATLSVPLFVVFSRPCLSILLHPSRLSATAATVLGAPLLSPKGYLFLERRAVRSASERLSSMH
jgi:hypothetical protein